jgi:hypothetical protein
MSLFPLTELRLSRDHEAYAQPEAATQLVLQEVEATAAAD